MCAEIVIIIICNPVREGSITFPGINCVHVAMNKIKKINVNEVSTTCVGSSGVGGGRKAKRDIPLPPAPLSFYFQQQSASNARFSTRLVTSVTRGK